MESFSYKDYIKCIHTMRLNAVMRLAEEERIYKISNNNNNYDSIIKKNLKNKDEILSLINKYLNPIEKIPKEEVELWNKPYKNKRYKNDEIEAIFKWNKKQIYFLIYYVEKITNKLFYKILNYCIDFMQDWIRNKKDTEKVHPLLVPIIIYTGKEKWKENIKSEGNEQQKNIYSKNKITPFYNFIEINKISDKELLESNSMFAYNMFIEKSKDKKDLKRRIKVLMQKIEDAEIKKKIIKQIEELLNQKIEKHKERGRLQQLNIKEEENIIMSTLIERLIKEEEQLIEENTEKIKNQIVRNMLMKNVKIETIERTTKKSIKEIYKIKSQVEAENLNKIATS